MEHCLYSGTGNACVRSSFPGATLKIFRRSSLKIVEFDSTFSVLCTSSRFAGRRPVKFGSIARVIYSRRFIGTCRLQLLAVCQHARRCCAETSGQWAVQTLETRPATRRPSQGFMVLRTGSPIRKNVQRKWVRPYIGSGAPLGKTAWLRNCNLNFHANCDRRRFANLSRTHERPL